MDLLFDLRLSLVLDLFLIPPPLVLILLLLGCLLFCLFISNCANASAGVKLGLPFCPAANITLKSAFSLLVYFLDLLLEILLIALAVSSLFCSSFDCSSL